MGPTGLLARVNYPPGGRSRPVVVRPLLPPGDPSADEGLKLRPVVTSTLFHLARIGHGIAGELELPGQSADAGRHGTVVDSHGCEIEVLQAWPTTGTAPEKGPPSR